MSGLPGRASQLVVPNVKALTGTGRGSGYPKANRRKEEMCCFAGIHKWNGWWDLGEYLVRDGLAYQPSWRQCAKCGCCDYVDVFRKRERYKNATAMMKAHPDAGWDKFLFMPKV